MTNPATYTSILRFVDSFQLDTQQLPTAAMIADAVPASDVGEALAQLVTDGFLFTEPKNLIYAVSYGGHYFLNLKTIEKTITPLPENMTDTALEVELDRQRELYDSLKDASHLSPRKITAMNNAYRSIIRIQTEQQTRQIRRGTYIG